MVMVAGKFMGKKIVMRHDELFIYEHILAWCIVCWGLGNRLCVNVSMAWHGMVWCGAVS